MALDDDDDSDQTPLISSGEIIVGQHLVQCESNIKRSNNKNGYKNKSNSPRNYSSITTTPVGNNSRWGHNRSCLQETGSKYMTIPEVEHQESLHLSIREDITGFVDNISNKSVGRSVKLSIENYQESNLHQSQTPLPRRLRLPSILLNAGRSSSKKKNPVHEHSCFFQFALQLIVILEMISLIFFVTMLLYTRTFESNLDRNKNAMGLFSYVLFMMVYGVFSLHISFGIGVKVITALLKCFATSVFFTLSLQNIILLPAFFFYFFPAVIATCINFVLTWQKEMYQKPHFATKTSNSFICEPCAESDWFLQKKKQLQIMQHY